jgi:hypothetical protein
LACTTVPRSLSLGLYAGSEAVASLALVRQFVAGGGCHLLGRRLRGCPGSMHLLLGCWRLWCLQAMLGSMRSVAVGGFGAYCRDARRNVAKT